MYVQRLIESKRGKLAIIDLGVDPSIRVCYDEL